MAIGIPRSSVTLEDILNSYSEFDILSHYLGITKIPCAICSPLRPDKRPSFGIYAGKGNKLQWRDFSTGETGGLFDLLQKLWHCSLSECLYRIYTETAPSGLSLNKQVKIQSLKHHSKTLKIECRIREWKDYDLDYWNSYGITKKWLDYAEVYPISHKIIYKNKQRFVFNADKYAYAYVERKEGKLQLKIYQPFNTRGFKWSSAMDRSVISLWTKMPQSGESVVICSSLKDALCLSCQLHIPAIACQGEGYPISNTALKELKRRFTQIFVCYDIDKAGIEDARKLSEYTGFTNVTELLIPYLKEAKDISDWYKSLKDKSIFQQLKDLFYV